MKLIVLVVSALVMAVAPAAAHAAPKASAPGATKQNYCESVIIITQDSITEYGYCVVYSDGSY